MEKKYGQRVMSLLNFLFQQTENELACKAVVLYRKNSRVCGVLTFNLFDDVHMNLAREVSFKSDIILFVVIGNRAIKLAQ